MRMPEFDGAAECIWGVFGSRRPDRHSKVYDLAAGWQMGISGSFCHRSR